MMRLFAAALAALTFTLGARAADAVKEIELTGFKPAARPMTAADKPTEITSAEDLEKTIPQKDVVENVKKQVDFSKQKLLFFAWSGSGQDKIKPDDVKDGSVSFNYTRGLTRDLRPHFHLFVMPKDAKWSVGNAK